MTTLEGVGLGPGRGRAPLVIAATIPLVVTAALPWRATQFIELAGFAQMSLALLVVCDLMTVILLLSHHHAGASPRLVALASAYLWAAGVTVMLTLASPGVIFDVPPFAPEANVVHWLWVARYVVPTALIAIALTPWPPAITARLERPQGRTRRATLSGLLVVVALIAVAVVAAHAPGLLPQIIESEAPARFTPVSVVVVLVLNLLAVGLAVLGVNSRGANNGVEAWAVVASVAFLGEVCLALLQQDPATLAFYLSRLLGVASSLFVMLAILHASSRLYEQSIVAATRLEEQNAALLESQRLRDHITAVVSHEMRTPLAGLQGYLELLREEDLDPAMSRRMVERSWMLTRRLTLLTEDLLAVATLEYGDLVVTAEHLDLETQLSECASCFPDLDLGLECPTGLTAYADPLRLQQILTNLVRNAQKHGAEPVVITAAPSPGETGSVTIRVQDAGEGVSAALVPQLFERYSQGSKSATGGSGLGLSVVRDLVAAHGGSVHYESGTNAFVVRLRAGPASRRPVRRPATLATHEPAAEQGAGILEQQSQT